MNVETFRHFFNYHFAENRKIWDSYISQLSDDQFRQTMGYSYGSVRDQIVHLMSVENTWFCGLRGAQIPEPLDSVDYDDRGLIRAYWDRVEAKMRLYLAGLRDGMLFNNPFPEGEDRDLILWQVLLHVVNHGTDHRAQILRFLNSFGVKTTSQDYIFCVYENLSTKFIPYRIEAANTESM